MKNAIFSWVLPTTRVEGGPLDESEIAFVQIQISADGGANFTDLGPVAPPDTSLAVNDLAFGDWIVRATVEDTAGRRSVDVDTPFTVADDSAPNGVVNVQVNLS